VISVTARRLGGPPSVTHIRDIANTRTERAVWKALQVFSDQMILVSRACWWKAGLPANVQVVYNGTRLDGGGITEMPRPSLTIGFVGRIHPAKGLHVLLSWVAATRKAGCPVDLIVRGAFAEETPEYEREIKDQILALGLKDWVRFDGFVSDPEQVYAGMRIVCVPSTAPDPLPRSVMEAMGRGLVVMASRSGGIPEMVVHGESGFLVDSQADFVGAVTQMMAAPDAVDRLSRMARARYQAMFTVERLHGDITRVYERVALLHKAS
jgi:glycosyltransferase involved in cell wall biosynthesis